MFGRKKNTDETEKAVWYTEGEMSRRENKEESCEERR